MTLEEARARDAADPLAHCRARFRLPDGKVYLDGNSLGALPAPALQRIARTVEREWGEDLIRSYDLGANSYIRKPVDFVEFIKAVQTVGTYWLTLNEPPVPR